jgi:hypothetical protein
MSNVPPPLPNEVAERLWYFTDSTNQPMGPVPLAKLKHLAQQGVIRPVDYVREKGTDAWVPFHTLQQLAASPNAKSEAPAPPPKLAVLQPSPAGAAVQSPTRTRLSTRTKILLTVWAVVIGGSLFLIVAIVGFIGSVIPEHQQTGSETESSATKAVYVETPDDRVKRVVRNVLGSALKKVDVQKADGGRVVWVDYDAASMMAGRKLRIDEKMKDVYHDIFTNSDVKVQSVTISVFLPFTDNYGKEESKVGYRTRMDSQTAQRIHWENRYSLNFDELWQVLFVHPSF